MGVIRIVLWGPPDSNRGLALLGVVPHAAIADYVKLDQVYGAPQELLKGLLEIQEIGEVVRNARLEFHEQVDVTVLGVEILAQDRTEQLELAHAI